jgi:trehalose synthase
MKKQRVTQIEDDEPLVGVETIGRMMKKAKPLDHLHGANVNSTYSGGGVAELLTSFTLLVNHVGIRKL